MLLNSLLMIAAYSLLLCAMMRHAGCLGRTYALQEVERQFR